jgi:D-serine dehydratase
VAVLRGLVGVIEDGVDAATAGLRPECGDLSLPVLTLDLAAFERNADAMLSYAAARNLLLAPHAKTPMSPELSRRLVEKGAWGLSVANLQQAAVMLENGFDRLLVANQIGGAVSGTRFGKVLSAYPAAEVTFFADSVPSVQSIAAAAEAAGRKLQVLVEIGRGRAGARDEATIAAIIAEILATDTLILSGIACYEGAVAKASAVETEAAIAELCAVSAHAFTQIRQARPDAELLLSAGGSSFFDLVVKHLLPLAEADGNARVMLRSGAIFFHDHGVYERALAQLDSRNGFASVTGKTAGDSFIPALRVWAEVLSRPEPDLLICGMGMRDVSSDQDLPRPLALYRNGDALPEGEATVFKLNDQHAFLRVSADHPAQVGDVVEFGISHPCTCIDRWRIIFGRGQDGAISASFPTYFG